MVQHIIHNATSRPAGDVCMEAGYGRTSSTLLWRHNGRDGVSNHQPHNFLLNHTFRRRSKKTSKLRVTGLCVGNYPVTGKIPAQRASNVENVFIWWRHNDALERCLLWCMCMCMSWFKDLKASCNVSLMMLYTIIILSCRSRECHTN